MKKKFMNIIGNVQKRHVVVIVLTTIFSALLAVFISHEFLKMFTIVYGDIITLVLASGLDISLMIDIYILIISGYLIYFNKFLSEKISFFYYFFRRNNSEK